MPREREAASREEEISPEECCREELGREKESHRGERRSWRELVVARGKAAAKRELPRGGCREEEEVVP